jgi:chromosome partitioning protein
VALVAQKGGAGKTTLAAHLAGELAAGGALVRCFDLDPQRSLTGWAARGSGFLKAAVVPLEARTAERLRERVAAELERVAFVLLDVPPGLADAALLAALVADLALIPCGPSALDLAAARDALAVVLEARAQRGDGRPLAAFVPNRIGRSTSSRELPEALEALGAPVLPGIGARTVVADAALEGLTLAEAAPAGSKARAEFQRLARAVRRMMR